MKNEGGIMIMNVIIERRNKDGTTIDREERHNIIVNNGLERMAKLLCKVSSEGFDYIAIGTGTDGALATDTELQTEVTRALATLAYEADYKATFEKTFEFESGDSYAITEAGIFDAESGSTMMNRFTFSAKNVDPDTDLWIKVTITFARG